MFFLVRTQTILKVNEIFVQFHKRLVSKLLCIEMTGSFLKRRRRRDKEKGKKACHKGIHGQVEVFINELLLNTVLKILFSSGPVVRRKLSALLAYTFLFLKQHSLTGDHSPFSMVRNKWMVTLSAKLTLPVI